MSRVKNWNCSYIKRKHHWELYRNQENTGKYGVRVYCTKCDQVDTLYAPYSRQYLDNALKVVAEAL